MKLKQLLFCIACFALSSNCKPLFAHGDDENMASVPVNAVNDGARARTENICDLLLKGYSDDEIIAIFNDSQDQSYKIQELVTQMHNLLDEWHSKEEVVNIVVNNKEAEEFYARKNFLIKVKTIIIFGVAIGLCYLFYRYVRGKELPTDNNLESDDSKLPQNERPKTSINQVLPDHCRSTQLLNEKQSLDVESFGKLSSDAANLKQPCTSTQLLNEDQSLSTRDDPFAPPKYCVIYDGRLDDRIEKQLEHVSKIGLEPAVIKFFAHKEKILPIYYRYDGRLCERIDQQIAYAKSIGLQPVALQRQSLFKSN